MTEPNAYEVTTAILEQTKPAPMKLGAPTTGHYCVTCDAATVDAADVLKLTLDGWVPVAVFFHCKRCGVAPAINGSEGE